MPTKIQKNQIATTLLDGWTPVDATWTYASASTITVPSGAASIYQKGDRIKLTQTTVKYFVLTTVADTLLTVAVNTDYTVANAAITLNYYSHQANPLGYPHWFNYTSTFAGWSANSTYDSTKFKIESNTCYISFDLSSGGTSNATTATFTLPVAAAKTTLGFSGAQHGADNGTTLSTVILKTTATSTTCDAYKAPLSTAWTGSGVKYFFFENIGYEF